MLTIMLEEKYVVFQTGFSTDAGSTATHTEDSSTQFLELAFTKIQQQAIGNRTMVRTDDIKQARGWGKQGSFRRNLT
jgi:hypothetical protein